MRSLEGVQIWEIHHYEAEPSRACIPDWMSGPSPPGLAVLLQDLDTLKRTAGSEPQCTAIGHCDTGTLYEREVKPLEGDTVRAYRMVYLRDDLQHRLVILYGFVVGSHTDLEREYTVARERLNDYLDQLARGVMTGKRSEGSHLVRMLLGTNTTTFGP